MELALFDGYDRRKRSSPRLLKFSTLTKEAVLALQPGDELWTPTVGDAAARRVRINGRIRTWKRDPGRVEVPCKYGFRECFTLNLYQATNGALLIPHDEVIWRRWGEAGEVGKFALAEYIRLLENKGISDDDGTGYFATSEKISNVQIDSGFSNYTAVKCGFTHVAWYSK